MMSAAGAESLNGYALDQRFRVKQFVVPHIVPNPHRGSTTDNRPNLGLLDERPNSKASSNERSDKPSNPTNPPTFSHFELLS
jgi:hypothetical protein